MAKKDKTEPAVPEKPSAETALMLCPRKTKFDALMGIIKIFRPDFEMPKLESNNLQIALSKLSESGYPGLNDVAKILMPGLEGEIVAARSQIEDIVSPQTVNTNSMDTKSIMTGLNQLFSADYPDLVGVARIWVPDFDKKIELLGAKNIKLAQVISPRVNDPDAPPKKGWIGMLRICYETVEPITSEEQKERTENAGCRPIYDHELNGFYTQFPKIVRLPAATSLITKGEGSWYMLTDKTLSNQPLVFKDGKMPDIVTLVAVCEQEFWEPLAKKDEK